MQGIYIRDQRPASKRAIRAAIAEVPHVVRIESTAFLGGDYDGPADELPAGRKIYFCGPCPYTARKYYGQLYSDRNGQLVVK